MQIIGEKRQRHSLWLGTHTYTHPPKRVSADEHMKSIRIDWRHAYNTFICIYIFLLYIRWYFISFVHKCKRCGSIKGRETNDEKTERKIISKLRVRREREKTQQVNRELHAFQFFGFIIIIIMIWLQFFVSLLLAFVRFVRMRCVLHTWTSSRAYTIFSNMFFFLLKLRKIPYCNNEKNNSVYATTYYTLLITHIHILCAV